MVNAVKAVIKRIFSLGCSVQVALGIVWMCRNIACVQDFAPVERGVYPVLLRVLGGFPTLVYALQIMAALGAGMRLLRLGIKGEKREAAALWGSLVLLTLPMAMQCHLALLPYSLVCSAGLLQLSFFIGLTKDGRQEKRAFWGGFAGIAACWCAQALLLPEYLLLGAAPTAFMLLSASVEAAERKKMSETGGLRGKGFVKKVLLPFGAGLLLGMGLLPVAVSHSGAEDGGFGIEWLLAKRVCWPTLWVDSDGLPDRIWETAGEVLWESTYYPENMERYFGAALRESLSAEEAKPLLREMIESAWAVHYPMIIRQVGWDVLGYGAAPVILPLQLAGESYESHSGRNYEIMRNEAPVLTKYYVDYCCRWFVAALTLALASGAVRLVSGERTGGRCGTAVPAAVLLSAGGAVLWYTLQGSGIMDYKYTVFIYEMWLILCLKIMGGESGNGEKGQR